MDIVGREHLLHWYLNRDPKATVRHVLTNMRTTLIDSGSVLVQSYVTLFFHALISSSNAAPPAAKVSMMGRYSDTLTNMDGVWLLTHREVQVDFQGDGAA